MEVPGPIAFVFDRGNPQKPDLQRAFDLFMQHPMSVKCKFGSLTFADDCKVKPLQAADFIAYEACKVYTDLATDKRRLRESLRLFLETVNTNISLGTEELMMSIVTKVEGSVTAPHWRCNIICVNCFGV